jgi:hypothetical protein
MYTMFSLSIYQLLSTHVASKAENEPTLAFVDLSCSFCSLYFIHNSQIMTLLLLILGYSGVLFLFPCDVRLAWTVEIFLFFLFFFLLFFIFSSSCFYSSSFFFGTGALHLQSRCYTTWTHFQTFYFFLLLVFLIVHFHIKTSFAAIINFDVLCFCFHCLYTIFDSTFLFVFDTFMI